MKQLQALRRNRGTPAIDATLAPDSTALTSTISSNPQPPAGFSFLAPPEQPDEIGRLGHYRVLKLLGHGGMGVVFQAEDAELAAAGRPQGDAAGRPPTPRPGERFLREARADGGRRARPHRHHLPGRRGPRRPVPGHAAAQGRAAGRLARARRGTLPAGRGRCASAGRSPRAWPRPTSRG